MTDMTDPRPIPEALIRIFLPTNSTADTGVFDAIADTASLIIRALLTHPAAQRWVLEDMVGRMDAPNDAAIANLVTALLGEERTW